MVMQDISGNHAPMRMAANDNQPDAGLERAFRYGDLAPYDLNDTSEKVQDFAA